MKYVILLADGMADWKIKELGNKTPLEYANTPYMDKLAKMGSTGLVKTIPVGMPMGSDTANLTVFGYDVTKSYTGRSPLEAYSIGVDLKDDELSFRVNLITLSQNEENYDDKLIVDHSSDEISTEDSGILMDALKEHFTKEDISFYKGVSYRHLMLWKNGNDKLILIPPHDVLGKKVKDNIPLNDENSFIYNMMKKSYEILNNHPLNIEREKKGLKKANSMWIWGMGTKPSIENFETKYGIKGAVISAVDLIKGIGIASGMKNIEVEGANGTFHTNYIGKRDACIDELVNGDSELVYLHIEAPDECGHRGETDNKVRSIEIIDRDVLGPIYETFMGKSMDFKILVLPDHPTPIEIQTHTNEPVPYLIFDSTSIKDNMIDSFNEDTCRVSQTLIDPGCNLMNKFLEK